MAVYKRGYRRYDGPLTGRWARFLVLPRYAWRRLYQQRLVLLLTMLAFVWPLLCAGFIYLTNHAELLQGLDRDFRQFIQVNGQFFSIFMYVQAGFAVFLAALAGPGLIAPDLTNNALPLYFCRPLSRTEYVLGRACLIVFLLSFVTWVPGLLIYGIQGTLVPGWAMSHLRIAAGIVVGSVLWIAILTLLALALSAWVRWKLVAGGLLLGVMFATTGFASAVAAVMNTSAGFYLDPAAMVAVIYGNFFDVEMHAGIGTPGACLALVAMSGFCVWLLSKKIRAFQVVR